MDIPKFKDIIKKVSFLQNYSSLLLPGIIILIGLLLFVPTSLMSRGLKKRIANESVSVGKRVASMSNSVVPRDQWKVEQKYQQAYEQDANEIARMVKQSSQRELLSYKLFPEPKDTSTLIFQEFGHRYRSGIDGLIVRVNALDCPTVTELQRGLKGGSRLSGSQRNSAFIMSRLNKVDAMIADVLCQEKAETAFVYANPADVSGYEFWGEYDYVGMDEAVEDCWYWQLAYWIIEDVFKTIEAANSRSNSVLASPVKRLMKTGFSRNQSKSRDATKPSYALSFTEGSLAMPHTARFCDDDIDVVHFNVTVVVNAKAVLPFMQQLCSAKEHKFKGFSGTEQARIFKHNQITVLKSEIKSINRHDPTHDLYRYGEDAVVELNLICEYIYNRNGYDEIKPKSVREDLGEKT